MPSPVGHALAGVAVGWLIEGRGGPTDRATLRTAAAYAAVAALPDLDLLLPFAVHRGASHGIGSAVLVGLIAWAVTRRRRHGVAFAAVYASHILLDWLGTDTSPPIGLMALWPFSREYYESSYHVFMAVSRRYWLPEFWTYNLRVFVRELVILTPMLLVAGVFRGVGRRTLTAVVAAGALTACAASAATAQTATYAEVVAQYRGGAFDEAVRALGELRRSVLAQERKLLERSAFGSLREEDVPAAILLHTEAHFASAAGQLASLPAPHLDAARRLARHALERLASSAATREFVLHWHLLLAAQFQGMRLVGRSGRLLEEARSLFPDEPGVLLASGSHHEMRTFFPNGIPLFDESGNSLGSEAVDVPKARLEAVRYFRAALGADPALHEAQLRLGRTLYLLGDLDAAAAELESVRTRTNNISLKYLACLFLALLMEDRGETMRGAALYAEAADISPGGQASFVGLSRLHYVQGEPDRAARVITALLAAPAQRDPWWSYMMGESWHFDLRLAWLRARVRR